MKQLNDENFEKEASSGLALVMFAAPWAGPCNLVRPSFESVSRRFGNQIIFGEFNLDDNPVVPEEYGVKQVPVFYLLNEGVPIAIKAGNIPEELIVQICEDALDV